MTNESSSSGCSQRNNPGYQRLLKAVLDPNFDSSQVNSISRRNSEIDMTSDSNHVNYSQRQALSISDPFDLYVQLQKERKQQVDNRYINPSSQANNTDNANNMGSFANNIGSIGDLSKVLSQGATTGATNGRSNQSWDKLNGANAISERLHSSLPIMNTSFANVSVNRHMNTPHSISMVNLHSNKRAADLQDGATNEHFAPMVADGIGNFHDIGNMVNGSNNSSRPEGVISDGFGSLTVNNGNSVSQKDFTKMTNEELREIIMTDVVGSRGLKGNLHGSSSAPTISATNKSNTNNSANPFLKNLGIMNYRNHVLPLHLQKHSSRRTRPCSINANQGMPQSDFMSSSTFSSSIGEMNNPYESTHQMEEVYGTMPDEEESYNAAANGIMAPWSARAAGLFGDMMEQSNADEKARKASRKKPKDKPKRPLSAYNIFFKEERNRILSSKDGNDAVDGESNEVSIEKEVNDDESTTRKDDEMKEKNGGNGHGKIGFESLAKLIGRRWQELDEKSMLVYKSKASVDMERYKREMEIWDAKHGTTSRKRYSKSKNAIKRRSNSVGSIDAEKCEKLAQTASSLVQKQEDLLLLQHRKSLEGDRSGSNDIRPMAFRELTKARLGSDLFQLDPIGEDNQPITLEQV